MNSSSQASRNHSKITLQLWNFKKVVIMNTWMGPISSCTLTIDISLLFLGCKRTKYSKPPDQVWTFSMNLKYSEKVRIYRASPIPRSTKIGLKTWHVSDGESANLSVGTNLTRTKEISKLVPDNVNESPNGFQHLASKLNIANMK